MTHDPLVARLRLRLGALTPLIDRERLDALHWRHARPLLVAAELVGVEGDLLVRWHDEADRPLAYGELERASTIRCGHLPLRRGRIAVGELHFLDPLGSAPRIEARVGEHSVGVAEIADAAVLEELAVSAAQALRRVEPREAAIVPLAGERRSAWRRLLARLGGE